MKLKVNLKVTQGKIYRFGLLVILFYASLFIVPSGSGSTTTRETATLPRDQAPVMDSGLSAADSNKLVDQTPNPSLGDESDKLENQTLRPSLEVISSKSERSNESFITWGEVCEQAGIQPADTMRGAKVKVIDETVRMIAGFYPSHGVDPTTYQATLLATRTTLVRTIEPLNAIVVQVPIASLRDFLNEWRTLNGIRYVEPSQIFSADAISNDPFWDEQWGPQMIQADLAWDIQMGDPDPTSVLVAVIDSGIDYNHEDLSAQYVAIGYDFVNDDWDPWDDYWHGTHCAGIIAATINNSIGIAGVANISIMAEKGLNDTGVGWDYDLADCIINATDAGADILSNSWGSYTPSILIESAVVYAENQNVMIVAAAGNDATEQAKDFHKEIPLDGIILAKMDADARGGALISVTFATGGVPILFLGTGQKYTDLEPFKPKKYVDQLLK